MHKKKIIALMLTAALTASPMVSGTVSYADTGIREYFSEKGFLQAARDAGENGVVVSGDTEAHAEKTIRYKDTTLLVYGSQEEAKESAEQIGADAQLNEVSVVEDSGKKVPEMDLSSKEKLKTVVAVIDTGVDEKALDGRIVKNKYNKATKNSHGTNVAQAVLAYADDSVGILPIAVLDDDGDGTVLDVCNAIRTAVKEGADVINLSLSAEGTSTLLEDVIKEAEDAGVVVVAASGNDGSDVKDYLPGNIKEAVVVSAVDEKGKPEGYSNHGDTVDYASLGDFGELSGTSMSSAYVSGRAAGLHATTGLSGKKLEKALEAEAVPAASAKEYIGNGVIYPQKVEEKVEAGAKNQKESVVQDSNAQEAKSADQEKENANAASQKTDTGTVKAPEKASETESKKVEGKTVRAAAPTLVSTAADFLKYAEKTSGSASIQLTNDIAIQNTINVKANITIDLNGCTLSQGKSRDTKDPFFKIYNGGTVRLQGSGIVTGNSGNITMQDNLFSVDAGGTLTATNVVFHNINNNAPESAGDETTGTTSLLYCEGSATFTGCEITNCDTEYGHLIWLPEKTGGSVTLDECYVHGNNGSIGGRHGTLKIKDTRIMNNVPGSKKSSGYGGLDVYVAADNKTKALNTFIYGTVIITGNKSRGSGAGIHNSSKLYIGYSSASTEVATTLNLADNQIDSTSTDLHGTAIYNNGDMHISSTATVFMTTNKHILKEALLYNSGAKGGKVVVDGSIEVHGAAEYGIVNTGTMTLHGTSDIYDNKGGGINNTGTLTINSANNKIHDNNDTNAPGIGIRNTGTLNMSAGEISGQGSHGISSSGTVTFSGGTIHNNSSRGINTSGTLNMSGGTVTNNSGRGISSSGTATISGGTISQNGNGSKPACGVYNDASGNLTVKGGTITANGTSGIANVGELHASGGISSKNQKYGIDNSAADDKTVAIGSIFLRENAIYGLYNEGTITSLGGARIGVASYESTSEYVPAINEAGGIYNKGDILGVNGSVIIAETDVIKNSGTIQQKDGAGTTVVIGTRKDEASKAFGTLFTNSGTAYFEKLWMAGAGENAVYNKDTFTVTENLRIHGNQFQNSYKTSDGKTAYRMEAGTTSLMKNGIKNEGADATTDITDNQSGYTIDNCTNGIYNVSGATYFNKGSIQKNTKGVLADGGTFTLNGGYICANTDNGLEIGKNAEAYLYGGAVGLSDYSVDGSTVSYRPAENKGYAVRNAGSIEVDGADIFSDTKEVLNNSGHATLYDAYIFSAQNKSGQVIQNDGTIYETGAKVFAGAGNGIRNEGLLYVGDDSADESQIPSISGAYKIEADTTTTGNYKATKGTQKNMDHAIVNVASGKISGHTVLRKGSIEYTKQSAVIVEDGIVDGNDGITISNAATGIENTQGRVRWYGGMINACSLGVDNQSTFHHAGGTIENNTIGVNQNGTYTMSGAAQITVKSDNSNEVVLQKGRVITVDGELTSKESCAKVKFADASDNYTGHVFVRTTGLNASDIQTLSNLPNHTRGRFLLDDGKPVGLGDKVNLNTLKNNPNLDPKDTDPTTQTLNGDPIFQSDGSGGMAYNLFVSKSYTVEADPYVNSYTLGGDEPDQTGLFTWSKTEAVEKHDKTAVKKFVTDMNIPEEYPEVKAKYDNQSYEIQKPAATWEKYWCEDLSVDLNADLGTPEVKNPYPFTFHFMYWYTNGKAKDGDTTDITRNASVITENGDWQRDDGNLIKDAKGRYREDSIKVHSAWKITYDQKYLYLPEAGNLANTIEFYLTKDVPINVPYVFDDPVDSYQNSNATQKKAFASAGVTFYKDIEAADKAANQDENVQHIAPKDGINVVVTKDAKGNVEYRAFTGWREKAGDPTYELYNDQTKEGEACKKIEGNPQKLIGEHVRKVYEESQKK